MSGSIFDADEESISFLLSFIQTRFAGFAAKIPATSTTFRNNAMALLPQQTR
jgi:hypothetical protein